MNKLIALVLGLLLCSSLVIAAQPASLKLKGWLIDNSCAAQHKVGKDMDEYVEVHDMSCARTCGKDSGFSLYAGGKLYPIAKSEINKVIKYFGADFNNDTRVVVTAKNCGSKLKPVLKIVSLKADKK